MAKPAASGKACTSAFAPAMDMRHVCLAGEGFAALRISGAGGECIWQLEPHAAQREPQSQPQSEPQPGDGEAGSRSQAHKAELLGNLPHFALSFE